MWYLFKMLTYIIDVHILIAQNNMCFEQNKGLLREAIKTSIYILVYNYLAHI